MPKDLSTFIKFSDKYGKINNLFKAVQQVNDLQPLQIIKLCKKIGKFSRGMTIAVLGVAFKENTDDIRSAVSVKIIQLLLKNKLHVKIHDPLAMENFRQIFGNKISYSENIKKCLKNTDFCIILTAWNQYKKLTPKIFTENMNSPNIIDARKVLDPMKFSKLNFHAIGLGD